MIRKASWTVLSMFIITLFLRKCGFGMSTFLMNLFLVLLCIIILSRPLLFKNLFPRIILSLFLILGAGLLQYWISFGLISTIIFSAWIIFSVFIFHTIRKNNFGLILWSTISFILMTSVMFNPREFYNFYRSTTYEEYIRSKYSEQRGIVADLFIDKYKKIDKEESDKYLSSALKGDSLRDDDNALVLYNKAIDQNPDNAFAYHRRGYLKLTHLDLNEDMAWSAIKDFDRALRLNPGYTIAYFHRGMALGYLNQKGRSYLDMKKVWETDSVLSEEEFLKKYGSSKEHFSIPFHP